MQNVKKNILDIKNIHKPPTETKSDGLSLKYSSAKEGGTDVLEFPKATRGR